MRPDRRTVAASLATLPWAAVQPAAAAAVTAAAPAADGPSALFAVEFRTGPAWDAARQPQEQPHFREHSQNLRRLREAGHLLIGARYADKGLVVLAASSEAAARALVEADPAVQHGTFAYQLHPFHLFYGGCVQPPATPPATG